MTWDQAEATVEEAPARGPVLKLSLTLAKQVAVLEDAISALRSRLEPVLVPGGQKEAEDKNQRVPREVQSPLVNDLRTTSDRLEAAIGSLRTIAQGCQV